MKFESIKAGCIFGGQKSCGRCHTRKRWPLYIASNGGGMRWQNDGISESEDTILISVRMTPSQREKFKTLGGSEWLRSKIDKAVMTENPEI